MLTIEHAKTIVNTIKTYVEKSVKGLSDRLETLEKNNKSFEPPKDGVDGRDALHLEVLPAINFDKSYPRGTFAKHEGGFWRAFETTSGTRGWECIVDGIKSISFEQTSERTFAARAEKSSGELTENVFKIQSLIDRGVFKAGNSYETGDVTTWTGSAWIAQADTTSQPGTDKTWRLAVKRGNEGKPGKDGKDLTSRNPVVRSL